MFKRQEDDKMLILRFINNGEPMVRAWVDQHYGEELSSSDLRVMMAARKWLYDQENERVRAREEQAVKSLQIASDAANASKQSARWTMIAAIVAAVSTFISLYSVLHGAH